MWAVEISAPRSQTCSSVPLTRWKMHSLIPKKAKTRHISLTCSLPCLKSPHSRSPLAHTPLRSCALLWTNSLYTCDCVHYFFFVLFFLLLSARHGYRCQSCHLHSSSGQCRRHQERESRPQQTEEWYKDGKSLCHFSVKHKFSLKAHLKVLQETHTLVSTLNSSRDLGRQ